jgi:glycosyltransferase involved in cell wall biosynthesis
MEGAMPHCVIIVENLPVPFDRRVWQEACALRGDGWDVSVICPANEQYPAISELIDGINIHRHRLPLEARGKIGFVLEYFVALFHQARLLLKMACTRGFDVIQICNPPDILFLNTLPYKLFGKRVVFDHHDLCPELFAAKFGTKGILQEVLLFTEWLTFKTANLVISSNESYRQVAMERGGKKEGDVVTVHSVPESSRLQRVAQNLQLRRGARIVLGYVGIIGDQDGVDHFVRMMHQLTAVHGLKDVYGVVVGDGPAAGSVKNLATSLALDKFITFTGYLRDQDLVSALSSFDIGVIPDPVNEYNNKISMNKVFEYSALGIPAVSYRLQETQRLLLGVGEFSDNDTPDGLARACIRLIQDDEFRRTKGDLAKNLADQTFNWSLEREKYLSAYRRLIQDGKTTQEVLADQHIN